MRIAILADIHANMYALQSVLNYIDNLGGVVYILNLGDLVQIGPHPAEVVDTVLKDDRFIHILGNNDLALIEREPEQFRQEELEHQEWTISQLGNDRLIRMAEWPESRNECIAGTNIQMLHIPLSEQDSISDVIVASGHTHSPHYLHNSWSKITEINPGSVGCMCGFSSSFAILDINEDDFSINFYNLNYDDKALVKDYERLRVPDREWLLKSLFGGCAS